MSRRWDDETGKLRNATQITMRWAGGVVVLDVAGYFTEDSEPALDSAYEEACALGAARLLLNFDGHGLITSAGYGLMIKLIRRVRDKGQDLRIAQPSQRTRRMLQIMGLTHTAPVYASEQEALEAFEEGNNSDLPL